MKKILFIAGCFIAIASYGQFNYPAASKDAVEDNYFGTTVADPYRWLENDTAHAVKNWVTAQNKITGSYLAEIPFRENIKKRLTELWNYPKQMAPFKQGAYYYFYRNNGLQNQNVLYRQKGLNAPAEVFLDPNELSADGTTSLTAISFSKDNKWCAVQTAAAGSDWNKIFIMDVATKKRLADTINWVKFSRAAWYKNGFYYSRYDEPAKGKELSNQNQFMKVYYHEIGKPQSEDKLVFERKDNPLLYLRAGITEDERFLYIVISKGTHGEELVLKDLSDKESSFKYIFKGFTNNYSVVGSKENSIFVQTNRGAPTFRLIEVDATRPDSSNWKDIIPQSDHLLMNVTMAGGKFFAVYLQNVSSKLYQYSYKGEKEKEISLPGIATITETNGRVKDKELFYSFVSIVNPGGVYKYDITTGKSELFYKTPVKFNPEDFETRQVFYTSKDGTKIPMFISYKKGLKLNGNNPTMLYGYGGFNISVTPSFSVSTIMFLERGGVYAIANLRGGGEYGEAWHEAGMLEKKQNVFDDFIAAGEYLIKEKYTSPAKLAISGASNGGLLVGACMLQRPELFKVAVPRVGVLDMLRYHKFTIGWGWSVEYGNSDNKEQFDYLIKYSPLHNIKENVNYPATLIMTADHDDRVVPAHSFKFAATLQEKYKGNNPILIRIESNAGHGAGKPTAKIIEEATDMWSFVINELSK